MNNLMGTPLMVEVEMRVVPVSREALSKFSRENLREYAKSLGCKRGRTKEDTICNLLESGNATLCGSLGD